MACDATTLAGLAAVLARVSDRGLERIQTDRLNLNPFGPSVTPQLLENAALRFRKLSFHLHMSIDTYLMGVISGLSTDPTVLMASAQAYDSMSQRDWDAAKTYLIALKAGGVMTAAAMETSAAQFNGFSAKDHWAAQTYCLAVIAGGSLDPQVLTVAAKGFIPLSNNDLLKMQLYTLCQWGSCVNVPASQVPSIVGVYVGNIIDHFTITYPQVCCAPDGWVQYGSNDPGMAGAVEIFRNHGAIPASAAGAVNYVQTNVPALGIGFSYYAFTQICSGGFESGMSNAVLSTDPALGIAAANAWSTRVVGNGGAAPSAASVTAAANFYNDLVVGGIISKMITVNMIAPDSAIAALTPLIVGPGNALWASNGLPGAGVLTNNGWLSSGDTGNHYMDPNIIPSNVAQWTVSNGGMSIYLMTLNGESSNTGQAGCFDGTRRFQFDLNDSSGPQSVANFCWSPATAAGGPGGSSWAPGFFSLNRVANNSNNVFHGDGYTFGLEYNNGAVNTDTPPTRKILFCGNNLNGTLFNSPQVNSFCALHDGLTQSEAQVLYNAVQRLRFAFGGGYFGNHDTTNAATVVTEWTNRVALNGGAAPSAGTKTALQNFWQAIITAGLHNKIIFANAFVPDSLIAALTPFIRGQGFDPWQNVGGFVAGDLTINGLKSNTTKYLNLGIQPNWRIFSPFDVGMTLYISLGSATNADNFGAGDAAFTKVFHITNANNVTAGALNTAAVNVQGADNAAVGYLSVNRIANNDLRIFRANSGLPHAQFGATNVGVDVDQRASVAFAINVFCTNWGGARGISDRRYSFCALHTGLTTAQSLDFYNAIQALRTALGGGFV